ncbi:MAG: polysulfide reductase NrfD [Chloroflexi bacterium]|nr:polysulfide reductase NrfD [Chloroflexota bacterium]
MQQAFAQSQTPRSGLVLFAYWVALLTVFAVGLVALYYRLTEGLAVTALSNLIGWGLWVALYIYFIGLSAGSFLLSTLIYVFGIKRYEPIGRLAVFSAFVALAGGLIFILLDLGHVDRFWTVFFNRNQSSVLEWEIHFYLLYLVILLAELWLLMRRDLVLRSRGADLKAQVARFLALGSRDVSEEADRQDSRWVRILGAIGIPVAIFVHGGTGAIFAVVEARPYWYSGLFPVIFLVSAFASGGGLLLFLASLSAGRRAEEYRAMLAGLGKLVAGILALDLLLLAIEMLVALYGSVPDLIATYQAIIAGPFWWVFWVQQLLIGALLPLILILFPRTGRSAGWVGIAGFLIVAGIFGVRLNIVIPPLTVPVLEGLPEAYGQGLAIAGLDYVAMMRPWLLVAGSIVILCLLLATIGLGRGPGRPAWIGAARALAGAGAVVLVFILASVASPGVVLFSSYASSPVFPLGFGPGGSSEAGRLSTYYAPSVIEWVSSAGVVAFCVILLTLGLSLLPVEEETAEHLDYSRNRGI